MSDTTIEIPSTRIEITVNAINKARAEHDDNPITADDLMIALEALVYGEVDGLAKDGAELYTCDGYAFILHILPRRANSRNE